MFHLTFYIVADHQTTYVNIESDQLRKFIKSVKGLIKVKTKITRSQRTVSVFMDDHNNFKIFILNKIKNEWTLLGNKDEMTTRKTKK